MTFRRRTSTLVSGVEPLPTAASPGPARIGDVAARAGVGVATVSRVINSRSGVRPSTRDRVVEAIEELNYRPSSLARGLSLQRTMVVATLLPWFTNPSAVERVRGIVEGLSASHYDLMVFDIESEDRQRRAFELFDRGDRADGLLVVSTLPPEREVERLQAAGIPCVLIDAVHPRLPSIAVDDVAGGELATRHLLDLGHRRIAFIGDKPPRVPLRLEPRPHARLRARARGGRDRGASRTTCGRERPTATSRARRRGPLCACPSGPPRSSRPPTRRRSACSMRLGCSASGPGGAFGDRLRRHRGRLLRRTDDSPPAAGRERPPWRRAAPGGAGGRAGRSRCTRRCHSNSSPGAPPGQLPPETAPLRSGHGEDREDRAGVARRARRPSSTASCARGAPSGPFSGRLLGARPRRRVLTAGRVRPGVVRLVGGEVRVRLRLAQLSIARRTSGGLTNIGTPATGWSGRR